MYVCICIYILLFSFIYIWLYHISYYMLFYYIILFYIILYMCISMYPYIHIHLIHQYSWWLCMSFIPLQPATPKETDKESTTPCVGGRGRLVSWVYGMIYGCISNQRGIRYIMDNIGCIGNGIADRFPGLVDRNFVELALHFGAKTLISCRFSVEAIRRFRGVYAANMVV